MPENSFFESLIIVGSILLKSFPILSACAALLSCFIETDKSLSSFSIVDLDEKPEFWEMAMALLIVKQYSTAMAVIPMILYSFFTVLI